ncbi:MAG: hypothetical protein QXG00_04190 [Candidatus Woesearchaeota archaeon]
MRKKFFAILFVFFLSAIFLSVETTAQTVSTSGRETIINFTNKAPGTYREVFSLGNYRYLSMHLQCSGGVTVTFWATNDPLANSLSDNYWVDVTQLLTGQSSITDQSGLFFIDTPFITYKLMVKYVLSDNTNYMKIINIRY